MGALLGDSDPERARRAMEAMLAMTKIDLAEMRLAMGGEPVRE
jgi:predicted 3-demethylubiquinone-9 3-methyltransferase (glyoxalase superfamily)